MTKAAKEGLAGQATAFEPVDIAFVVESTYPYMRGGVSAVVHEIALAHPDKSIGVIHIAWDSSRPSTDVYGMPPHVRWVYPLYLSMEEHLDDFRALTPAALRTGAAGRRALARRLFTALRAAADQQDYTELWRLYDDGINPYTRRYTLWALMRTKEFLVEARQQLAPLEISLTDLFWLLRDFFSLACAVMGPAYPRAEIYHAHTTGYAALASAVAARQHKTRFLLTEHNLYTRDTINGLLDTSLNRVVRAEDWRTAQHVSVRDRAWMAWYIEIGRLAYQAADTITYLYPQAVEEAVGLGAIPQKTFVIPNGTAVEAFDPAYRHFQQLSAQRDQQQQPWRLAFAARIVPIKGLLVLLEALAILRNRGIRFTLDVMGHDDETPDYADHCRRRCTELALDGQVRFTGNQDLHQVLAHYDLLVLPSFNEAMPLVVLEAMAVGLPVVGTRVGGMAHIVEYPLNTYGGDDRCGVLVRPGDPRGLAGALHLVLSDAHIYQHLKSNARNRVFGHFRLEQATFAYRNIYYDLMTKAAQDAFPGRDERPHRTPSVVGPPPFPRPRKEARPPSSALPVSYDASGSAQLPGGAAD